MKKVFLFSFVLLFSLTACFKDNPTRETLKAAGSWKVLSVEIKEYDNTGNETSSKTIDNPGFLMLSHVDDFLYEGTYSYSLNADLLSNSAIYSHLKAFNQWGVTTDVKVFNLAYKDPSSGASAFKYGYTINTLTYRKFELQYVQLQNNNLDIKQVEVWKMERANE
jgi:hypothetical protein